MIDEDLTTKIFPFHLITSYKLITADSAPDTENNTLALMSKCRALLSSPTLLFLPADNSTDVLFLCDNNLIQMIIERCFVPYDKDGRKVLSKRSPFLLFRLFLHFTYE